MLTCWDTRWCCWWPAGSVTGSGPKNLYLIGLVVFTLASVWCGLSGGAAMLITARVVQGVGAGLLTPQTLSTITRIFPAQRRGVAVSVWGATAGVASLVGPLAGGVLVDGLGWQWIFFVNVPVGIAGLALAVWLIPELPTQAHRFDLVGVALSGVGMFSIVFGLQQGQSAHWQPWIWALIVAGIGLMTAFVYWQSVNTREPLIPLQIFSDRDFSLCNIGVAITSFASTALMLPLTFYTQAVCGLSPTRSALVIAPMAIANGVLAPFVGRMVDRYHPRPVLGFGFSVLAIGLTWLSFEMAPDTPIWRLVLPFTAVGVGMAFVWSPLTATATRNLPPRAGRRELRGVQLGAPAGRGARKRRHGRVHDMADQCRDAAGIHRDRQRRHLATARLRARAVLGRDVGIGVAARIRRVVRHCRRAVFDWLRARGAGPRKPECGLARAPRRRRRRLRRRQLCRVHPSGAGALRPAFLPALVRGHPDAVSARKVPSSVRPAGVVGR